MATNLGERKSEFKPVILLHLLKMALYHILLVPEISARNPGVVEDLRVLRVNANTKFRYLASLVVSPDQKDTQWES